jgi:uncharacterized protein YcgI (DUF1989 family)
MSMEHCRVAIDKLTPVVGDAMVTNKRRPIITLLEDTTPGVHDTPVAACDVHRYQHLGAKGYHDNCTDNLWTALKAIGLTAPETSCPFNLFQNTQYVAGRGIQYLPTVAKPGQYVVFRAELDTVVCVLGRSPGPATGQPRRADGGACRADVTARGAVSLLSRAWLISPRGAKYEDRHPSSPTSSASWLLPSKFSNE